MLLTQASCYRFSAMEVMHRLINSTAHFVRCVRSNGDSAADTWDTGEGAAEFRCPGSFSWGRDVDQCRDAEQ